MKKAIFCIMVAAGFAAGSSTAFAQANTSSATADSSTSIIQPLTIVKDADLVFGRIVKPRSGGTGTVSIANNSNTVSATAGAVALGGITTSRAAFTVAGEGGQVVTVSMPSTFNLASGDNTITVTLLPDFGSTVTLSNALGAAGNKVLNVGGSFNLADTQANGAYTGQFAVTVAYQ